MENKAYTLRALKAGDIFLFVRLLNKIGMRDLKKCFESDDVKAAITGMTSGEGADNLSAIGLQVVFELAGLIMEHLPDCRDEIYQLLAALSGMSEQEIADMPMGTFFEMVVDVIKAEEFKDFFQRVAGSFKQEK